VCGDIVEEKACGSTNSQLYFYKIVQAQSQQLQVGCVNPPLRLTIAKATMGKKDKPGKKGENEDVKRDQKLQAILMAVSFTKYFRPISYIKPKVMLPLVNVPMLMYTIEFLAQNGVEEVCSSCLFFCQKLTLDCRYLCFVSDTPS
jgi:hypothetical protein